MQFSGDGLGTEAQALAHPPAAIILTTHAHQPRSIASAAPTTSTRLRGSFAALNPRSLNRPAASTSFRRLPAQSYSFIGSLPNHTASEKLIVLAGDTLLQIREVWAENLEIEMALLRETIDKYPYVAMDTEFPGIVARPIGTFKGSSDYHYQTLRCNVDLLKLIQLGITLCDENGNLPPDVCTWQFNFRFSIKYVAP
ncbi:mRNA deadenylase subunit [Moesziomyces antarcticus T-34]|uniref:poly(A)-specific ribonuclease n=1 Tax=Pseudozyma antarctica (strain T-34) TaxID=1151754 RepID=M9M380_PSEA3|nr:mRNA deadenylase subunit [Moesziomyces antarcticus T-34]